MQSTFKNMYKYVCAYKVYIFMKNLHLITGRNMTESCRGSLQVIRLAVIFILFFIFVCVSKVFLNLKNTFLNNSVGLLKDPCGHCSVTQRSPRWLRRAARGRQRRKVCFSLPRQDAQLQTLWPLGRAPGALEAAHRHRASPATTA